MHNLFVKRHRIGLEERLPTQETLLTENRIQRKGDVTEAFIKKEDGGNGQCLKSRFTQRSIFRRRKMKRVLSTIALITAVLLTGCQTPDSGKAGSQYGGSESIADTARTSEGVKANSIRFPAYPVENPNGLPYYEDLNLTPPFTVQVDFPDKWEIRETNDGETVPTGELYSKLFLYDGDKLIGYIGFDIFEPYTEEIAQEEYYKTVYSKLRLPSTAVWDPYTAVKASDMAETGIVEIWYLNPNEIDQNPGAMPNVPQLQTTGILSYQRELRVYIGIAFMPDTVDKAQAEAIAKTVSLSPEEEK